MIKRVAEAVAARRTFRWQERGDFEDTKKTLSPGRTVAKERHKTAGDHRDTEESDNGELF